MSQRAMPTSELPSVFPVSPTPTTPHLPRAFPLPQAHLSAPPGEGPLLCPPRPLSLPPRCAVYRILQRLEGAPVAPTLPLPRGLYAPSMVDMRITLTVSPSPAESSSVQPCSGPQSPFAHLLKNSTGLQSAESNFEYLDTNISVTVQPATSRADLPSPIYPCAVGYSSEVYTAREGTACGTERLADPCTSMKTDSAESAGMFQEPRS